MSSVRQAFNSLIIKNSYSDRLASLASASNSGLVDRSYGLSNNLFDSFGFISSMLISVTFCYGLERKNTKVIWLSVISLLMPLVNSRTGLVLALIGFLINGYYYSNTRKFRVFLCSIPLLLIIASSVLAQLPESMITWVTSGFQETIELLNGGGRTGVYSKIFNRDLILPPEILFGAGGMPKELISYGVDNGYINCLWSFGAIGTVLLLSGYVYMFYVAYKLSFSKAEKAITISIAAIFFVYLIKVYSIDNFGGITLVFGLITVIIGTAKFRQLG